MTINRRRFLTLGSVGFIGVQFTNSVFASILPNANFQLSITTIAQKLKQAANKRKNGNYADAIALCNEVIATNPLEIRAYDSKRRTLLQQKYKELEVFNLYYSALLLYPNNKIFKQRVASEYTRLALGNKKYTDQLNMPDDLLEKAKILLGGVKLEVPIDEQIAKQFGKTDDKIDAMASSVDARQNQAIKNNKKSHHIEFKNRFENMTETEVKSKLDALLDKSDDAFRDVHIRSTYKAYIYKLKANGKSNEAAEFSKKLFHFDKQDSDSLNVARKICRKEGKFNTLVEIEIKNEGIKKTFWAKIALFDALYHRYKNDGVGRFSDMQRILTQAAPKRFTFYQKFEQLVRETQLIILQNNQTAINAKLNIFADTLIGTKSAHFIDKFNVLYIKHLIQLGNKEKAFEAIAIALKEPNMQVNDAFHKKLVQVNANKKTDKPIHNQRLQALRNEI